MAAKPRKVIISCAITGGVHTPSMSEHLPVTPDQIAAQAIGAAQAGAAIVHLHARNPADGKPSADPAIYMQFLPRIKQAADVVVNITTGGGLGMSVDDRIAAAKLAKPEMASLNMGSMNFNLAPMAAMPIEWKHAWEKPALEASKDSIFRNTFGDIERILGELGRFDTKFEHECYDVGHLYNLAHVLDQGLVKPPIFVQFIFGILGGIGADHDNLIFMKRTADRLFGADTYVWSVLAAGRHQMPFGTLGAMMGGSVRVGLEDSLYAGKGKMASSNAEQVTKLRRILDELSLEAATPAEARQMLGLKGADRTEF
ncbi:MAG: 3-keto-5-aminohexanoate cleavage protein [Rhodospirillales bacterium]|nr:3-keto-5-aminohexanoate cleavage protein [Rhodospirillales bacterium]